MKHEDFNLGCTCDLCRIQFDRWINANVPGVPPEIRNEIFEKGSRFLTSTGGAVHLTTDLGGELWLTIRFAKEPPKKW